MVASRSAPSTALLYLLVPTTVLCVGRFSYRDDDLYGPDNWLQVKDAGDNYWRKWPTLKTTKNECKSRDHRESPVNLIKTEKCRGDHHMLLKEGTCKLDDINFKIQPWGLAGYYEGRCNAPSIDIADSFHERAASRFDLKVPSEHTIEGKRYDAEFYIAHFHNVLPENAGNRDNRVAMTSVLLDARDDDKNDWLEELIDEWEDVAKRERSGRCRGIDAAPAKTPKELPFAVPSDVPIGHTAPAANPRAFVGCYKTVQSELLMCVEAQKDGTSTEECATLCQDYKYFARESRGRCLCGHVNDAYYRHGASNSCRCNADDVGANVACVYIKRERWDRRLSKKKLRRERQDRRLKKKKKKKKWDLHAPFKKAYYYGYKGSITMPPCSDFVHWYVLNKPQRISKSQLKRIQVLIKGHLDTNCQFGTYADRNGGVARPIQSIKGRNIFHCTKADY